MSPARCSIDREREQWKNGGGGRENVGRPGRGSDGEG